MERKQRTGFTLIELSIVLVIIGLIVGGVLVGRDLIVAATLRKQIKQIEQYSTAVRAFKLKYDGFPGDLTCTQANGLGLPTTTTYCSSLNGNGYLDWNGIPGRWDNIEANYFFPQLSAAGLIADHVTTTENTANVPFSVISPQTYTVAHSSFITYGGNWFVIGCTGAGGTWLASFCPNPGAISPLQSQTIDTKIDDGIFYSGHVQAIRFDWPSIGGNDLYGTYWQIGCVQSGNLLYATTDSTANGCLLAFAMQ